MVGRHASLLRQLLGPAPVTGRGEERDLPAVAGLQQKTGMKTGGQMAGAFSQPCAVAGVVAGLWLLPQSSGSAAGPVVERVWG